MILFIAGAVFPLPHLERLQFGGDHTADLYLKVADYVQRAAPNLTQLLVYFDERTFSRGPHSVLGHLSAFNLHSSRSNSSGMFSWMKI